MRKTSTVFMLLFALVLLLTACGGDAVAMAPC